jgi:hypothetical protein
MKMKKTNPTPKSITHKKPMKIPPSSRKSQNPKITRYIPAKYHKDKTLKMFKKKNNVIRAKFCKIKTSCKIKTKRI